MSVGLGFLRFAFVRRPAAVLFAVVVVGLLCSALSQEIGWEERF